MPERRRSEGSGRSVNTVTLHPGLWARMMQPLSQLHNWTLNRKVLLIYGALFSYSVLYALYHQWLIAIESPFVAPVYSRIMVHEQFMLMGLTLLLMGISYALRRAERWQMPLAYGAMLFYSSSLIFQAYQVGLFTFPVGVVLAAGPMFTFTFMPFRVVYGATAAAVVTLLVVCTLVSLGHLPNAPLYRPEFWISPQARPLMFGSLAYFALPHLLTLMGLFDLTLRTRERREQEIQHLSVSDGLTGLYNRRHILDCLSRALSERQEQGLSVVLLDVDHFKQINDRYGHLVGDAALRQVAQVMTTQIRAGDWLGRYGGEEFLLVLPHTGLEQALEVAHRHCQALSGTTLEAEGQRLQLSASYGVCSTEQGLQDCDGLLHAADRAMYAAKAQGRNRVQSYDVALAPQTASPSA